MGDAGSLTNLCGRGYLLLLEQAIGSTETGPGLSVGGAVEYFTSRTVSLKGEARVYATLGRSAKGQVLK
jgi:hypothetical protein